MAGLLASAMLLGLKPDRAFAAAIEDRAFHRGFVILPSMGVSLPLGDPFRGFDLGFRAGGLVGHHVLSFLSVNGEVSFDFLNPNNVELGESLQARVTDFVLSPFFHVALERGEIVVGPRMGAFTSSSSQTYDDVTAREDRARGLAYGFNLGVFGGIGNVAVGALLGYTRRHTTKTEVITTQGWIAGRDVPNTLSVAVAALF
jgi:hypothetical protein